MGDRTHRGQGHRHESSRAGSQAGREPPRSVDREEEQARSLMRTTSIQQRSETATHAPRTVTPAAPPSLRPPPAWVRSITLPPLSATSQQNIAMVPPLGSHPPTSALQPSAQQEAENEARRREMNARIDMHGGGAWPRSATSGHDALVPAYGQPQRQDAERQPSPIPLTSYQRPATRRRKSNDEESIALKNPVKASKVRDMKKENDNRSFESIAHELNISEDECRALWISLTTASKEEKATISMRATQERQMARRIPDNYESRIKVDARVRGSASKDTKDLQEQLGRAEIEKGEERKRRIKEDEARRAQEESKRAKIARELEERKLEKEAKKKERERKRKEDNDTKKAKADFKKTEKERKAKEKDDAKRKREEEKEKKDQSKKPRRR